MNVKRILWADYLITIIPICAFVSWTYKKYMNLLNPDLTPSKTSFTTIMIRNSIEWVPVYMANYFVRMPITFIVKKICEYEVTHCACSLPSDLTTRWQQTTM